MYLYICQNSLRIRTSTYTHNIINGIVTLIKSSSYTTAASTLSYPTLKTPYLKKLSNCYRKQRTHFLLQLVDENSIFMIRFKYFTYFPSRWTVESQKSDIWKSQEKTKFSLSSFPIPKKISIVDVSALSLEMQCQKNILTVAYLLFQNQKMKGFLSLLQNYAWYLWVVHLHYWLLTTLQWLFVLSLNRIKFDIDSESMQKFIIFN